MTIFLLDYVECVFGSSLRIFMTLQVCSLNILSAMSQLELCVCMCVGRLLNGKFWIWIALGSFDSQLNLGRMCFICLLPRERERDGVHLTTTVAGSRNRNRSKGSTSIEATFQKWNCICSAWETIITLSPSLLPTPSHPTQYGPQFIQLWKYFMCANKNISFIEFRVDFRPCSDSWTVQDAKLFQRLEWGTATSAIASASGCHNWCELPHC